MNNFSDARVITIDDVEYRINDLSDIAKLQVENIHFSDEQLSQLRNELSISNTARNGYLRAIQKELGNN